MYQCLAQLNPDDIYTITKHLYLEMVASGTSHVGEFHYVHHQPDGTPYPDSLAMSKAIIAAAKDAGLRLTLLRTIYLRGDFDAEPQPQQRRFIDPDLKSVRASLDALIKLEDAHCTVGLAPHSVRAVSPDALRELKSGYRDRPFHIHVSEQPRENDGCQQHYGMSPVHLLEESDVSTRALYWSTPPTCLPMISQLLLSGARRSVSALQPRQTSATGLGLHATI